MPVIKNNVIAELGLEDRVDILVAQHVSPANIAKKLEEDPEVIARLDGRRILQSHIKLHLERKHDGERTKNLLALTDSDFSKELMLAARERLTGLYRQAEQVETIGDFILQDLSRERDLYLAGLDEPKNGEEPNKHSPRTYLSMVELTYKHVQTMLNVVKSIKGDEQVHQILKARTVNVNQGYTQEELFDILFQVGAALGHTRMQVIEAFSKTRATKIIETQVTDAEVKPNAI